MGAALEDKAAVEAVFAELSLKKKKKNQRRTRRRRKRRGIKRGRRSGRGVARVRHLKLLMWPLVPLPLTVPSSSGCTMRWPNGILVLPRRRSTEWFHQR